MICGKTKPFTHYFTLNNFFTLVNINNFNETSIEFQLDKLSEKDLKDDSLINTYIRCDQGVREKLIISHNDLVLSCYMNWNQGSFDLKLNKKELIQILNKKRFDEINSEDFTDFLSEI